MGFYEIEEIFVILQRKNTKTMKYKILIVITLILGWSYGEACTNFICSRGASADGSTMITYVADSHTRYGQLPRQ